MSPRAAGDARQPPQAVDAGNAFSWRFVTPLLAGSSVNAINSSLIATALVPIAAAVHVPVGRTSVLVAVLYLASAVAQPTGGKLAEEFGPRRVFLAGASIVLIGGITGGLGQDLATLIIARVLIGIGSSAGYPPAMLLIRRRAQQAGLAAPPGGVLGGLQIAATVTATLGLPLGGVLVWAWGWRAVFFVNVPFALAALAMAARWIPKDGPVEIPGGIREVADRIDLAGIAGFAGAITALLVFLLSLPRPDWVALTAAAVAGAGLILWELRTARPFIDVRLLASNGALTRTYIRIGLTLLCVYTVVYGLTQWLQAGRDIPAEQAGLLLLPMSAVGAIVSRPIARRNLIRGPLLAAATSSLIASIGVLFLTTSTAIIWIVAITVIYGVTTGTTTIGNQTALYTQVTTGQTGTASGLFRTFGYAGSIAAATITSLTFRTHVNDNSLHHIAIILTAVSATALLLTLADRRLHTPAQGSGTASPPHTVATEPTKPTRDTTHTEETNG
jgi:MFS family permease